MVTFTEAFNVVCRMVSTDSVGSIGASICELIHKQSKWSQETFGKDGERGPIGPLNHIKKEVDEALLDPHSLEEYADIFLLSVESSRRAGFSFETLLLAAIAKQTVNMTRKWPKSSLPDSPTEHIQEGGE